MEVTGNISKKKMITYSVIISLLIVGIIILLIQRKFILNQLAAPSDSSTITIDQITGEAANQVNEQEVTSIIDTSLFSNSKFQALKKK